MDKIKVETGNVAELIPSAGGVFEITVDGQLIYSKKSTGRFPEESDIVSRLKKR